MKKSSLLVFLGLLACSVVPGFAAAPLLRYEFNTPGSTQASTGSKSLSLTTGNYVNTATDYITAAPVQRKGTSSNFALNLKGSNVDGGLTTANTSKGAAQVTLDDSNAAFLRSELGSFTISGWVLQAASTSNTDQGLRRLFALRNAAGNPIIDFSLSTKSGEVNSSLYLTLYGVQGQKDFNPTSVNIPVNSSDWYFISITYDAITGKIDFYSGEEGGTGLSHGTGSNASSGVVNTLLKDANALGIGNVAYLHQRRVDAYLSDFRFYDQALSSQEIDVIYGIPEPGVSLLMGAGALVACLRPWKLVPR